MLIPEYDGPPMTQHEAAQELFGAIVTARDSDDRLLSYVFRILPSKEVSSYMQQFFAQIFLRILTQILTCCGVCWPLRNFMLCVKLVYKLLTYILPTILTDDTLLQLAILLCCLKVCFVYPRNVVKLVISSFQKVFVSQLFVENATVDLLLKFPSYVLHIRALQVVPWASILV